MSIIHETIMARIPGMKKAHEPITYTKKMIEELKRCAQDPIHFIRNYVYIKTVKYGKMKFNLYDYQEEYINLMLNNDRVITLQSRQVGKSITSAAFLLWWAIFKSDQVILIASNNAVNAKEIIDKVKYAYEELPNWLKPGVDETAYNKHEVRFDNKSRIVATTTSENSGRGMAISLLYCDELGFVAKHVAESFWDSIIPTVSTGGRIIISSTPNGDIGKFAEIWRTAVNDIDGNEFVPFHVEWNRPPGRDEAFKKKFMAILGERKWRQEYECEFLSEELTLIDYALLTPAELRIQERITTDQHIKLSLNSNKFEFFEYPKNNKVYIVGVDPNSGSGNDNGVIQVYEFPSMVQIMEYATNTLSPQVMYTELRSILKYLDAFSDEVYFSVESNGVGQGILAAYEGDGDPPNAALISDNKKTMGVNSNARTKLRACIQLKEAFERGKLTINSLELIKELKSFVRQSGSYSAQTGATDDRIMATIVCYYVIYNMAEMNYDAYNMIYSIASDIEERHTWKSPVNDSKSDEEIVNEYMQTRFAVDPWDRGKVMDEFFNRLHGINDGNSGIII